MVRLGENEDDAYLYTRVSKRFKYSNFKRDRGTYLIAYHASGYSSVSEAYSRMLKFANDEGLDLHGFFYEDVLLDDLSVRGYEEYVIKISVLISKK